MATTWPLAVHPTRLPTGTEPAATVPFFNLWTLRWTADRLPHLLQGWWDAPIFSPTRGTFAFSEPEPLTGAAYWLLHPVAGDAAYATILVATLALNGLAGAALARRLGAAAVPAALAGVLAQTVPFVFGQLGVLQLAALWPLLAVLACIVAWAERPAPWYAAGAGLALAAAVFTCGYYALLLGLCALAGAPFLIERRWRDQWRARLGGVAAAAGVAAAVSVPLVLAQQHRLAGRRWGADTVRSGSAALGEWRPNGDLWPGGLIVLLAVGGAWVGRRRAPVRFLAAVAVAGVLASLGTRLSVGGWHPWTTLADHVDAVARLRSPFRAAAVVQVAAAALAAPALHRLWQHPQTRPIGPVAVLFAVVLGWAGPGPLAPIPDASATAWSTWLVEHPDGGSVVALPFAPGPAEADFEPTTAAMLAALDHGHPLVNGYSGFFPTDHGALRADLAGFPDAAGLDALRRRDTTYVVADADWFDRGRREAAATLGLTVLVDDADGALLALPDP